MKIDIEEVEKSNYTLEDVLVLVEMEYARRGKKFPYSGTTTEQYTALYNKGILKATENGYTISVEGYQELRKIIGVAPLKLKKEIKESNFEEFWNTFPVSDNHGNWLRTRTLKSNKSNCLKLYEKALADGVEHATIMKALKWEIADRKARSITSNKLTFMKNTSTWLYQKEYEIISETIGNTENDVDNNDWTINTV